MIKRLLLLVLLFGCAQMQSSPINTSFNLSKSDAIAEPPAEVESVADIPIKRVQEGELVSFPNLSAKDPDGDRIAYRFTKPLDENGTWHTKSGDAGVYETTIIASDGTSDTRQDVRIIVESRNEPPYFVDLQDVTVREGEKVDLNLRTADPDGDDVRVTVAGWHDVFPYQTTHQDAGVHTVRVRAMDGTHTIERVVTISVEDVNRPPTIYPFDPVEVTEGEVIQLVPEAEDPDEDELNFTFHAPLNATGAWETQQGDAGVHKAKVTVTDDKVMDSTTVRLLVHPFNAPPVLEPLENVTVQEGERVEVDVLAHDPEGENVTIRFSGWMETPVKTTTYDDAGRHEVLITASDGVRETNRSFYVIVNNVNRPPVFRPHAFD